MKSSEILSVDLEAFEKGNATQRRAVVEATMDSLVNGFVYAATDLSEELLDTAYGKLESFFSLPAPVKDTYAAPGADGQVGYTGLLVEQAEALELPDWKEMLNWPSLPSPTEHPLAKKYPNRYLKGIFPNMHIPGIQKALQEFSTTVLDVQLRVLRIVAEGLGVDKNFFDQICSGAPHLSRAIHYPEMELAPGDEHVWAGKHGDINLITALPRATAAGLQIWIETDNNGNGYWIDAAPPSGHVILNTGLMLERISNGVIPAGIHQVISDSPGSRMSVVQFCHPSPDTILAPLESCVTAERPVAYETKTASDALKEVLEAIGIAN